MASRRLSTYGLAAALAISGVWLLSHSFSSLSFRHDLDFPARDRERSYFSQPQQVPADIPADPISPPANLHKGVRPVHGHGHGQEQQKDQEKSDQETETEKETGAQLDPLRRRNVTFATSFMYHGDVYMALAKSMGDVMDAAADGAGAQIHVFAQTFPFGFQDVLEDLHLWKHQGVRGSHPEFVDFLNSNSSATDEGSEEGSGGVVDLVVLGTCQYDLPLWSDALTDAWNKRDEDHKFKIVCCVHNVNDMDWQRWIPYWSQRNAIRLIALGDHVANEFRRKFAEAADSRDEALSTADFEHVPIDVHIPVLDVPGLPARESPRQLTRAVIQGKFEVDRRDYNRIFEELIGSLNDDPAAWGYHPLDGRPSYEADEASAVPAFQLLLVGSQYIGIPQELANVVVIHRDLPYKEFYKLIADSDIVLPAFAGNSYYEIRASSTVALATELNVPMLVTNRTRRTYGFIDDDRVVVTRPAAMSEVQALKALRTGDAASFLQHRAAGGVAMGEMPAVREAVERMMREGWVRGAEGWARWKEGLWRRNREVAERILRDLP